MKSNSRWPDAVWPSLQNNNIEKDLSKLFWRQLFNSQVSDRKRKEKKEIMRKVLGFGLGEGEGERERESIAY